MHYFKDVLIKPDAFEDYMFNSQPNSLSWESIAVFPEENNTLFNQNETLNRKLKIFKI
jgi:hypothetical protein